MTITAEAPSADPPVTARRRRRRWAAGLAAVIVVAGGVVTFLSLRAHYRDAPPLSCACGLRWDAPDSSHARNADAGPWTASIVPARPGHVQAFEVMLVNRSSVTQTIIGGDHDDGQTAEPVDVTFARPTGSVLADQSDMPTSAFSAKPAVLAPGGVRWVRYAIHTADLPGLWTTGRRTESFSTLDLRVRIGAWTRWQHIDLDDFAFVLRGK